MSDYTTSNITKAAQSPTRDGFGKALLEAAKSNPNIVALCADLSESTRMNWFAEAFPERFIEIGVAEQNLVTVGAGMAAMGKIPFVSSYAAFSPGRNWEQIRTTVCLNNQPVKIIGSHAGLYTGADGATHQMLEDLALMRVLPNMVTIAPGDANEAYKATLAVAADPHPAYIQLAREKTPLFTSEKAPFEIGKAYVIAPGEDVTIISTGTMTAQAIEAVEALYHDGIDAEHIHLPTLKPFDGDTVLKSAKKTKRVVTIEGGQIIGGLGGAVSEFLSEFFPVPIKRLGMQDRFGESGKPEELFDHFGLSLKHLVHAVKGFVK